MEGKTKINLNVLIYIIITFIFNLKLFTCRNCNLVNELDDSECFNILLINSSTYRAGHFAKNKAGDVIVEYSSENQRLFYGLQENGKYYFENDSHFKIKNVTKIDISGKIFEGRYESYNIFISTKNDINKTKEYLFSLSSYKTLLEIFDIENDLIFNNVTQIVFQNGIFSYQFALFGSTIGNINTYICSNIIKSIVFIIVKKL